MRILSSNGVLYGLGMMFLVALGFAACGDINSGGDEGEGMMNLYLTDAPGDYEEVNVDVQAVRIRYIAGSDTADTAAADTGEVDEGQARWIDLPVEPFKINLLDLADADTLISEADLEPGRYNELRLILGDDNDVVVDGETHKLTTPSAQQSGYKIKFNSWLDSGEIMDVTVDFEAGPSVHKAGNSGKYILKPVLKAFVGRADTTNAD